jgi:hypothetical protein
MSASRADSDILEHNLPDSSSSTSVHLSSRSFVSPRSQEFHETVRKPIAGEGENKAVLSRYQAKTGKHFLVEKLLPPKQQTSSTIEGKQTKSKFYCQIKLTKVLQSANTNPNMFTRSNLPHQILQIGSSQQ